MGEYAEMALDGTMCQGCGEYLGGGAGFPRFCRSCNRADAKRKPNEDFSGREMPLSAKLRKRLEIIRQDCDTDMGMYPGCYWDEAARQHERLRARGFVEIYEPHNPSHKPRCIITAKGRAVLDRKP